MARAIVQADRPVASDDILAFLGGVAGSCGKPVAASLKAISEFEPQDLLDALAVLVGFSNFASSDEVLAQPVLELVDALAVEELRGDVLHAERLDRQTSADLEAGLTESLEEPLEAIVTVLAAMRALGSLRSSFADGTSEEILAKMEPSSSELGFAPGAIARLSLQARKVFGES